MAKSNIKYLGQAWIAKHGMFDVIITPRGGMELTHTHFRRRREIGLVARESGELVQVADVGFDAQGRKFRTHFKNYLLAHLAQDFKQCTIFYLDSDGCVLGTIAFDYWIFDHGKERMILGIESNNGLRLCLPPMKKHVVPQGTATIAFRFEWIGVGLKLRKYSAEAKVIKDLRALPRRPHQAVPKQYKKVATG